MKMLAKEDQIVGLLRLLEARAEVISGSQFTFLTSTKVQILLEGRAEVMSGSQFTSTKVLVQKCKY
jgi:hypothetical protein